MIIFNTYLGNSKIFMEHQFKEFYEKLIYQPYLSFFMFYGSGYLKIIDPVIRNKLIKRTVLIKAINQINDYFFNQNMILYEDTLINFMLYKTCKSLYFLNIIGYFYISNQDSTTKKFINNKLYAYRLLISFFYFLKFIFDYTKNSKYEKDIANIILEKEFNSILTYNNFKKINDNLNFFLKIINLYLRNKFISLSIKKKLKYIKEIIIRKQKNYYI